MPKKVWSSGSYIHASDINNNNNNNQANAAEAVPRDHMGRTPRCASFVLHGRLYVACRRSTSPRSRRSSRVLRGMSLPWMGVHCPPRPTAPPAPPTTCARAQHATGCIWQGWAPGVCTPCLVGLFHRCIACRPRGQGQSESSRRRCASRTPRDEARHFSFCRAVFRCNGQQLQESTSGASWTTRARCGPWGPGGHVPAREAGRLARSQMH